MLYIRRSNWITMVRKNRSNTWKVLFFSRWWRKSYALFQTLGKQVLIAVLSVSYFLTVPVESQSAVTDTTKIEQNYYLDEIEVTAQRSPVLYSEVARVLTVLSREDIECAAAENIQDLLVYVAGVDIRRRGAEGVQADIGIRGGTFDQTLILLNGVNITDPQSGHHNLNIPVSIDQIERIEILEGPAARVYGPNAFSGAVNIITRSSEASSVEAKVSVGSYKYFSSAGSMSIKKSNAGFTFSAENKKSDGYTENTDFGIINLFHKSELEFPKGKLNWQVGYGVKKFGANNFYTPKYPNQYEETRILFSAVRWQSNFNWHFTPVVYWRNHNDLFELFRDNPPEWYRGHNYHKTNTYGTSASFWKLDRFGKTAFGIEFRSENILSNVLGNELDDPRPIRGEDGWFTKSFGRNTASAYFEKTLRFSKFSISAGVLANYIGGMSAPINFFPGIDVGYQFSDKLRMVSSFNTSMRMPTFTELYYSGPTNLGNPDLKPEKINSFEWGIKYQQKLLQGSIMLFSNKGSNIIDWIKEKEDDLWTSRNLTKLSGFGTEASLSVALNEKFGNYFPRHFTISYLLNYVDKQKSTFISYYVLDNIRQKLAGSFTYQFYDKFLFTMKVVAQDRAGTYTEFSNGSYGEEVNYPPFWLADGSLSYTVGKVKFNVSVSNIFNRFYFDLGNIHQPGRWIKLGVVYQLPLNP